MINALKTIDRISEWSGRISCFVIYAGIACLVYEVGARYLFNAPTIWAHGTTQRIFAISKDGPLGSLWRRDSNPYRFLFYLDFESQIASQEVQVVPTALPEHH